MKFTFVLALAAAITLPDSTEKKDAVHDAAKLALNGNKKEDQQSLTQEQL